MSCYFKTNISYGIDNERRKTIETKTENGNITATRTKFFANNYELIQTTQNSSFQEKEILYIFAPDGLFAINETKNGVNKMYCDFIFFASILKEGK
jgi:hypothetical protein